MNLTSAAIRYNRVTLVVFFSLVVAGLSAYQAMPRDEDPGFIIRVAQIVTYFPGASPERIESLITDPLEKAVQEMPELDFVESYSKAGVSIILVIVQDRYSDMRPIWDSLRRKVDRVSRNLPEGVIGPFTDDEFGDVFGIVIGLTGDGYNYAELKSVADEARDELLRLDQAAKVDIYGAQEERVFIEYSQKRLAALGISPQALLGLLAARNIILSGGEVTVGESGEAMPERIILEPSGNFQSLDDLRQTVLEIPGRSEVTTLGDVVTVRRGYLDPPTAKVRTNRKTGAHYAICSLQSDAAKAIATEQCDTGTPALGLGVSLRKGGNIIELGDGVREVLDHLNARFPHGITFEPIIFQPDEVARKITEFESNLLQAVAVVLAVMLLTLGLRTGAVVASLVPMTIIASFLMMSWFNIGIDQVSLAALIIALGMLVDNAIVISESTMVRMQNGESALDAAIGSANELKVSLLTSSLTTAAAFLPIYLAESQTGEYTAPLFKVVTITLLLSWFFALTLIPMLAVKFIKVKPRDPGEAYKGLGYRIHHRILEWMLRHRAISLVGTFVVFIAAMGLFGLVRQLFFPESDRALFTLQLELPAGAPIEETTKVVQSLEDLFVDEFPTGKGKAGITGWGTFMGGGEPRFNLGYNPKLGEPGYTLMIVNVDDQLGIDPMLKRVEQFVHDNWPDVDVSARRLANGPPVSYPIEVRIEGKDRDQLFELVGQVKAKMESIRGVKGPVDDWGRRTKKLIVDVNQARARRAGLTNEDIAFSLQTVLSGISGTQFRESDKAIPITMRSVAADRQDVGKIDSLLVYSKINGQAIPLKQVADVFPVWEPSLIRRRNVEKTITVKTNLEEGVTATEVNAVLAPWLAEVAAKEWPAGYKYNLGGEAEETAKANESINEKLPIAGFIILILLVSQFNSLRKAFIVLCTIPLGLIGVGVGLLTFNSYFGFMTFLGVISLVGIVINNAIVLLERIQIEIDEGRDPFTAILMASKLRMRPILLTTATTVAGLVPLWLSGGPMWEPMAIAIIFGLLFSTVMTLGVIPVVYATLFRVRPVN